MNPRQKTVRRKGRDVWRKQLKERGSKDPKVSKRKTKSLQPNYNERNKDRYKGKKNKRNIGKGRNVKTSGRKTRDSNEKNWRTTEGDRNPKATGENIQGEKIEDEKINCEKESQKEEERQELEGIGKLLQKEIKEAEKMIKIKKD